MTFNPEDMVTYKELSPSLQELINSKTPLVDFNSHIGNNDMHITEGEREKWNVAAKDGKDGKDGVDAFKNIGSVFVGEAGWNNLITSPTYPKFSVYSDLSSKGMIPDSNGWKGCIINQTSSIVDYIPAGVNKFWVTMPYYLPFYEGPIPPGLPGLNLGIHACTWQMNITNAVSICRENAFFSYNYGPMQAHGHLGYVVWVFSVTAITPFNQGATFELSLNAKGAIDVKGFENLSQFPLGYSQLSTMLQHPCVDINTLVSYAKTHTSPPTSL